MVETNSLVDFISEPCQGLSGALLLMLSAFRRTQSHGPHLQRRSVVPLAGLPEHFLQAHLLLRDSR